MSVLTPPRLACDIAWATNPLVDLSDPSVAWVEVTSYLELDKGVTIGRRRSDELDEPNPGTASVVFDNTGGEFTQLHPASPFYPQVKINRLIRYRSVYPDTINIAARQAATGGGDLGTAAGMTAPSGTVTAVTGMATGSVAGTTTTLKCADADATDIDVGDVITLNPALNANCGFELGTTGWVAPWGTFTQANDQVYSGAWSGKRVPSGTDPWGSISSSPHVTVTPGTSYTMTAQLRCATARNMFLAIHWYDAGGVERATTFSAPLAIAANTWTPMSLTYTAPGGMVAASIDCTMDGTPPAADIMWIDEVALRLTSPPAAFVQVTGKSSAGGTTTMTFSPAAATATAAGDRATRYRYQWVTGLQPVTGARLSIGDTPTTTAGPDAIPVTAGLSYTWSAYTTRTGAAYAAPVALTGVNDVTTATVTASATLTGNKPSAVADGDLLVAVLDSRNSAGTWDTIPSGWTLAAGQNTSGTSAIYVKPIPSAAAETATTYTWHTTGGAARGMIVISRVTGADLTNPVDAAGAAVTSGTSSIVAPAVTAVSGTALLVGMFVSYLGTSTQPVVSAPTGMTEIAGVPVSTGSATSYLEVSAQQLSAAGSSGTRTAAVSPAGTAAAGQMITIAPAAPSGAVSVSPRILWYDLTGTLISETTGSVTALTTSVQRLGVSAAAPAGAVLARGALATETVLAGSPSIAYRDGTTAKAQSSNKLSVTIPASVQAGDGLLMWVEVSNQPSVVPTPAGWTYVADQIDGTSPWQARTYLFTAVATSAGAGTSAGSVVNLTQDQFARFVAVLEAYSGTDPAGHVHQWAVAAESGISATHTTPNVTTTMANCWIASACFDRSTSTSVWTQPAADTLRHAVYTTGSPSATGCVSDNAAPVAAGTYGAKVFTSNISSDNASMWTVALKPSPSSGGSSATIQMTGGQFEQAGAASAWVSPGLTKIHFVGHASGFPTSWWGGVRPLCTIAAVDRQKLLDAITLKAAITQQILSTGPVCYYPLNEDPGATGAGNAAGISQPALPIVSAGAVTDDMLTFGGGTGPGTDGQQALKLTPASTTVGKALRGTLSTPLGGDGITAMSIAVTWNYPGTADASTRVMGGCDDGKPTDSGAAGIFDIGGTGTGPASLRAHLRMAGVDIQANVGANYFDKLTHQGVATAEISGGVVTLKLYVDGILQATQTASTSATEFPLYTRFNAGCGAFDVVSLLFSGTLSHTAGWNVALSLAQVQDLYTATFTAFAGDLSGTRAARLAAWAGVTTTAFDAGRQLLEGHRSAEATLNENLKLIARSEGGVYFLSSDGYATLHDRAHRVNAVSRWSVSAADVKGDLAWLHDDRLVINDVTVKRTASSTRVVDLISQQTDGYGVRSDGGDIDTIVDSDASALALAQAHLIRYAQPVSRPGEISIELLGRPELYDMLRGAEISDKFTITGLPATAPATSVDLFVEGVGMTISERSWLMVFDASPASFDFGLILDDPIRGLLDSNYVGW